jgi:hypothetical protein
MNSRTRKTDTEQGINKLKVVALKIIKQQLKDKDKQTRLEAATKVLHLDSLFRNSSSMHLDCMPSNGF